MFWIKFDNDIVNEAILEVLTERNESAGIFCVFENCDDNFIVLVEETR